MNILYPSLKGLVLLLCALCLQPLQAQTADDIIRKVDEHISADNRIVKSTIIVHGKRNRRTFTTMNYTVGTQKAFTEYLQPAREKGTKMLKLNKDMWIYSPSTDRTLMISGHMLRQSVMGSDMSYEDLMEDRKLHEMYAAELLGQEKVDEILCYKLKLKAKVQDVAYDQCMIWVDVRRLIPLVQEYYAKSGKLLKRLHLMNYKKIEGKWTPMKSNYKDVMKDGEGTDMLIESIRYNRSIPASYFNKGALKK